MATVARRLNSRELVFGPSQDFDWLVVIDHFGVIGVVVDLSLVVAHSLLVQYLPVFLIQLVKRFPRQSLGVLRSEVNLISFRLEVVVLEVN